jgi:hypothetical protein
MNFAARGNWHWAFNVKWLDFYTGVSLGYLYSTHSYLPLSLGVQTGAHFYFGKNIGIMGEFGYPVFAKMGLALKF